MGLDSTSSPCPPTSSPFGTPMAGSASPSSAATTPTMSVQHYRSQFVKEGLKMKVQKKLGISPGSTPAASPMDSGPPLTSPSAAAAATPCSSSSWAPIPGPSGIAAAPSSRVSTPGSTGSAAAAAAAACEGRQQQQTPPLDVKDIKMEELTEEDEVRRQRRRERNKVAATKCRNKKKLRTQLLVRVSDSRNG